MFKNSGESRYSVNNLRLHEFHRCILIKKVLIVRRDLVFMDPTGVLGFVLNKII